MSITCLNCDRYVPIENKDLGLCATCNQFLRDQDPLYSEVRKAFIEMCIRNGVRCPRCRTLVDKDFTVHHKAGRIGYADRWAQEMGITLLLDVRFFLALDIECHQFIETHPTLAKTRGWSLSRLGIKKSPIPEAELEGIKQAMVIYKSQAGCATGASPSE